MKKPRIKASSARWVCYIDEHIRSCNLRGPFSSFVDAAADPLDGAAFRSELRDLIDRRMLKVIEYGYDDTKGRDPHRGRDPNLCGTWWSVNPTEKMIRAFWPDRITA